MSKIFGGSKSKQQSTQSSSSSNRAYEPIQQAFSPLLPYAQQGASSLAALLGGDRSGFERYMDTTGFDVERDQGESAIGRMFGSKGLRNSGSALKGLTKFNSDLKNKYSNDYISKLLGLSQLGSNAGSALISAGGVSSSQGQSTGSSSSNNGFGDFLGKVIGAAAASDRRLKENIEKVGELANGLGVYTYNYLSQSAKRLGVMADEVAKIQPDALGPTVSGYMTVDYGKVEGWEYA